MDTNYDKGLRYELIARAIFQQILDESSGINVRVEHLTTVEGLRTRHAIDVLWEFQIGSILYRTLVQVKNWKTRVKQEHVLAFKAVLDDIPGQPRGVIVSRSGFQRGAQRVAVASGIKSFQLGPIGVQSVQVASTDWMTLNVNEKTMQIECTVYNPRFRAQFKVARETPKSPQFELLPIDKYLLFDEEGNSLGTILDVLLKPVHELRDSGQAEATVTHTFDEPTYVRPEGSETQVRLFALTAQITVSIRSLPPVQMVPSGFVEFVLKNLQTGDSSICAINSRAEVWKRPSSNSPTRS